MLKLRIQNVAVMSFHSPVGSSNETFPPFHNAFLGISYLTHALRASPSGETSQRAGTAIQTTAERQMIDILVFTALLQQR